MEKPLKSTSHPIPWGRIAGIVLVCLAGAYASQHPHTFLYHFVKFIFLPVP
ncbi:hypothetical protein SAMN05421771_1564 [Granulicella pectinivorans]|uniref:Uncharacterized protein n=1 Tax=Granulicella pectinivorans TaxID=474950 RepID=A0A1I6LZR3_9BACT|nr:hypothetical protein SAMN05421771_1564 [Granulicella pectinivorans]